MVKQAHILLYSNKIHQMDVKTTFLNGIIEEEVYIEQLDSRVF
jgi:hypothetical protein